MDRQIERKKDIKRDRYIDRKIHMQKEKRQVDTKIERYKDRQMRQMRQMSYIGKMRWKDRQKETKNGSE